MNSRPISTDNGFALVEMMVVIAIIAGLFAIGSFVDLSTMNRKSITAEQATLVSVLQKARNRAMNNMYASPHGVHIKDDSYIIFRETYIESNPTNEIVPRNNKFDDGDNFEIIFEQLSGKTNHAKITFTGGKYVEVYENGLIDW